MLRIVAFVTPYPSHPQYEKDLFAHGQTHLLEYVGRHLGHEIGIVHINPDFHGIAGRLNGGDAAFKSVDAQSGGSRLGYIDMTRQNGNLADVTALVGNGEFQSPAADLHNPLTQVPAVIAVQDIRRSAAGD